MIVPFNAIFEYAQQITGGITQEEFYKFAGVGKTTFTKSKTGLGGKKLYSPSDSINGIYFYAFCHKRIYDVNNTNYKDKATDFIAYLENGNKIHKDYINIHNYLYRIENEIVPASEKEFENFLSTSAFWDFFKEYISLGQNEEYRNAEPPEIDVVKGANIMVDFRDNLEAHMPQYLTNTITGEIELTVSWKKDICDFSYFTKHPLVLVSGPGGQGKSLLLYVIKNLKQSSKKVFDEVVIVPLIFLTALTVDETTIDSDPLERFIKIRYPNVDIKNPEKRYLLLIDGYNEYRISKEKNLTESISNRIESLIKSILEKKVENLSLVLTTRETDATLEMLPYAGKGFRVLSLSGTSENVINAIKQQFREHSYDFEGTEIEQLIKIPLYALMIQELKSEEDLTRIQDKYALLDSVYMARAKQRLGSELRKNSYNKGYFLYFYYVILPAFSYELNTSKKFNDYYFWKSDVETLHNSSTENDLDKRIFRFYRDKFQKNSENGISAIEADAPSISLTEMESFLQNEGSDIIKKQTIDGKESFQFLHQEWRDYLTAKYLHTNVELLKNNYNKPNCEFIHTLRLSCNVDSNIASMVLQSFDMASTPEHNAMKAKSFFSINGSISPHLYGIVKLLHTAFDFNEYLQLKLPEGKNKTNPTLHKIFQSLTKYLQSCLWVEETEENKSQELSDYQKNRRIKRERILDRIRSNADLSYCLCEIFSKESEFFRREYDYKHDWMIVKIAKEINPDSDIMLNQEAKMYLCVFEDRITPGKKLPKNCQIEVFDAISNEDLYTNGMSLMRAVVEKGFHLSANLLGLLLSNPAPLLIKNVNNLKPDYCNAFKYYLGVIYTAGYTKRDIAYTVRQALGLLIKGYIRVSEYNLFDPEDCETEESATDISMLITKPCFPLYSQDVDENSARLAWFLVEKVEGQELAGLNYLRGCVAFAQNKLELAKHYWHSSLKNENDLLYYIVRKYRLYEEGLDNRIDNAFVEMAKSVRGDGQIDRTHSAYWYIEAKETELFLLASQQKEERIKYFSNLERLYCDTEVLQNVYNFLKRKND